MAELTADERKVMILGLVALQKRLKDKIKNDVKNGRNDLQRVICRTAKIQQASKLICKLTEAI
jgi:hypothetical protein